MIIRSPNQDILQEEFGNNEIKYQVVTEFEGEYSFCFENTSNTEVLTVDFQFKTGVEAKDYSQLVSKEEGVNFLVSAQ